MKMSTVSRRNTGLASKGVRPSTAAGARVAVAGMACLALALTALGCGSDSDSSSSSSTKGGENNVPAEVKANLAKAKAIPEVVSPGGPVDVSKVRGKSIFVIPLTTADEYNVLLDKAMAEVAELTDVKITFHENQGKVNQWVAGMNQAIAQKVDLIDISGAANPLLLKPQIAAAKKAGIKVIVSQFWDNTTPTSGCGNEMTIDCATGVDAIIPSPYQLASRLDADWIINHSNGEANTLVVTSNDIGASRGQAAAIKDEFAKYCPDCKTTFVDVPSAQWATDMQSTIQSKLNQDPSITYVIPLYDLEVPATVAALKLANRQNAKIATFNGTPSVLKMITPDGMVGADVGQNLAQMGYASMDQAFRILSGMPASKTAEDVTRLFDADNVAEAGTPPKANGGFGDGYLDYYKRLWGLE